MLDSVFVFIRSFEGVREALLDDAKDGFVCCSLENS
jgi:hypothetical protein